MVPIPADFRVTVFLQQLSPSLREPDYVWIEGVPTVPFVRVHAQLRREGCGRVLQELRYQVPQGSSDPHNVPVSKRFGLLEPAHCTPQIAERYDLWIVASENTWPWGDQVVPRTSATSGNALGILDVPTDLSNAVGHIGGVLIKTVPYEICQIIGQPPLPPFCMLTYDDVGAMLTGVIRDACGGFLVDADVRLEPVAFDSAGQKKVRLAPSGMLGEHRIAALEPGVPYELTVSHPHFRHMPPGPEGFPTYVEHTDTLEFQPGGHMTLDIVLERAGPC